MICLIPKRYYLLFDNIVQAESTIQEFYVVGAREWRMERKNVQKAEVYMKRVLKMKKAGSRKCKIKGWPGKLLVTAVVQCQTAAPGKIP